MHDPIPAAFGKLRSVDACAMDLGHSRMPTVVFSFRTQLVDFLRGHAQPLESFAGAPRTVVYFNSRLVVVYPRGTEVTFNPQFLPFTDRYGSGPWPTWPWEPHEKGPVERPIFHVRDNF